MVLLLSIKELHQKLNIVSLGSKVMYHASKKNTVIGYTCIVQAAVENFLSTKAHIIYTDASFCRDNGKLITMCFLDQNHQLQPLGCHYCFREEARSYRTLFEQLWDSGLHQLGGKDDNGNTKELIIVSDAGTAVISFVEYVNKHYDIKIDHVLCVTHFLRHLKGHIVDNDGKVDRECAEGIISLFYYARRSPVELVANKFLSRIRESSEEAYKYIKENGMSTFVYKYDSPHFCADSNNASESLNNLLNKKDQNDKSIRTSTIFGTISRFACLTLECLIKRKACLDFEKCCLLENAWNYNYFCRYIVHQLIMIGYRYEVLKSRYQVKNDSSVFDSDWDCIFHVDFSIRQCSCKMWQQTLHPCIHAVALLHSQRRYHEVFSYIDDSYKTQSIWEIIPDIDKDYKSVLKSISETDINKYESPLKHLKVFRSPRTNKKRRRLSAYEKVTFQKRAKMDKSNDKNVKKAKVRKVTESTITVPIRLQASRACKQKTVSNIKKRKC